MCKYKVLHILGRASLKPLGGKPSLGIKSTKRKKSTLTQHTSYGKLTTTSTNKSHLKTTSFVYLILLVPANSNNSNLIKAMLTLAALFHQPAERHSSKVPSNYTPQANLLKQHHHFKYIQKSQTV